MCGEEHSHADANLDLTTLHVRRAVAGHQDSLAWIAARFTPVLLAQARYRLGTNFRNVCEPQDLVNDVWATALPRLAELPPKGGRFTPVVMKFLSTTLLYHYNNLAKKLIRGKPVREETSSGTDSAGGGPVTGLPEETLGVVTRISREEARTAVMQAIEELDPADREVVILRGIEQNPVQSIATLIGKSENAVSIRYHRALKKLRTLLANSIFDDFPEA